MPSEISRIIRAYKLALDESQNRYESLYSTRGQNALDFYNRYASRLVRKFGESFQDTGFRRRLHRQIKRALGADTVDFVAIDGSCNKDLFNDFIVFSACAYGAKGQLDLDESGDRPRIKYRRWELERDVSMVAYVPVPFAQLAEAVGQKEDFLLSDQDRINLASVHTKLMQLAEIYLAYNVVTSSTIERPRLLLMDLLPSSVMASIAGQPTEVNLGGYEFDRRRLDYKDIVVALAHPFNDALQLPNHNRFRLHQLILGELHRSRQSRINLRDVARRCGINENDILNAAKGAPLYGDASRYADAPGGIQDLLTNEFTPRAARLGVLTGDTFISQYVDPTGRPSMLDVRQAWEFTVALFKYLCDQLFRRKEPNAMIYEVVDMDGRRREHWLDPSDIDFLIAVGIRALVEAAWEQKVMLIGIAKDSASRYLTRNYIGILRYALKLEGLEDLEVGKLPWTDRMFFEFVAGLADDLQSPWSTTEFDSAFMTLWISSLVNDDGTESFKLGAVQDHIVAHTHLFARSLGQFFLRRDKETPLMGHVVFIDRLLNSEVDVRAPRLDLSSPPLEENGLSSHRLGLLRPLGYTSASEENLGQDMAMYLLSCLTRNHYPEVIGYPDPLHKADWGAKTLGARLRATIRSSEIAFRARPLSKTLRSIRDSYGRR